MPEFRRKRLTHGTPNWVANSASYFVTICAIPRGQNHLAHDDTANAIYGAIQHYHGTRWYADLLLVMPDHIHGIFTFHLENYKLRGIFKPFKSYLAKAHGITWQEDFFEHRLRDDREYIEKAKYIRENPVRAGLMGQTERWPYYWEKFDT